MSGSSARKDLTKIPPNGTEQEQQAVVEGRNLGDHRWTSLTLTVEGLDCADCTRQLEEELGRVPGVIDVRVLPLTQKITLVLDPECGQEAAITETIVRHGYTIRTAQPVSEQTWKRICLVTVGAVGIVLVVIVAELTGLLDVANRLLPWPLWLTGILWGGWPVLLDVARSAWQRRVTAHTLMTIGAVAAIVVGEWATAAVVVLFMRLGALLEAVTGQAATQALQELSALAPQQARIRRENGEEVEVPASSVQVGDVVVVRAGEAIPLDGEVIEGVALSEEAALTGESLPRTVRPGDPVFAATLLRQGYLQVRVTAPAQESIFARMIRLVEAAESSRGRVQRLADRFAGRYLPLVAAVALVTFAVHQELYTVAAVLVVACACSFAIATPMAVVATVTRAARHGILIKGGAALEKLAQADVILIDKTGTLTFGRPLLTDIITLDTQVSRQDLLSLAASAEWYAKHPLAEAIRSAAQAEGARVLTPEHFEAEVGKGVTALIAGTRIRVGTPLQSNEAVEALRASGKTVVSVERDGQCLGLLAFADLVRPGVAEALTTLRELGIQRIEHITGDHEEAARTLAEPLGIAWRARLLPEDKLRIVEDYQAAGHVLVMIGDGINDAPALARADVGIAMGELGTALAAETAQVVLLREDWQLIPRAIAWARRALRVAKTNLIATAGYNLVGLTLAAAGLLPPTLAATAQVIPDVFILGNSARLSRDEKREPERSVKSAPGHSQLA